jgi:spore photoproduct lyase
MTEKALIKQFKNIYIEESSLSSNSAKRVLQIFPEDRIHIIKNKSELKTLSNMSAKQFNESKRNLLLSSFKGKFFKRCPGARPGLICCNYFVLNLGQHCEMDCSYCYLQNLINFPFVTIYTNIEDALSELTEIAQEMKGQKLRIGTGEITDSLSLDDISLYSARLVNYFKEKPEWTLEFKTKSANIKNFVDKEHCGNIIVSWSLNPQYIIEKEEHNTASLKDRLNAARLCRNRGFPVAFHLDPVIYHEDWKENYSDMVQKICTLFKPTEISHISLGALRFQPEQRHLMRERFGMNSLITRGEYFKSSDGKLRYDSELRQEMFRFIFSQFKSYHPKWNLFLCMENKENWMAVTDNIPSKIEHTKSLFDLKPVRLFSQASN